MVKTYRGSKRGGKVVRDSVTARPPEPAVGTTITNQSATQDTPFTFQFAAGAFTGPGTYSATKADNSALPAWLSFNAGTRTFSGTPLVGDVGTLSVKVKKSDNFNNVASQTFNIVVAGA